VRAFFVSGKKEELKTKGNRMIETESLLRKGRRGRKIISKQGTGGAG